MATRAFILCGDEKAVHAVTQILDELEVSFQHSGEPPFALKRLAVQRFDLLIVDCDNAQNATQVFNSARASTLNKNSIAVAIVEGKAGVPNAFRLGASLVLTKPVSLEQARNTLRTGVGMTRKDTPEVKPLAAPTPASTTSGTVTPVPGPAASLAPATTPVASPAGTSPSPIVHLSVAQMLAAPAATALPAVPSTNKSEPIAKPAAAQPSATEKHLLVPRPVSVPSKPMQEHKPALTNFTEPKSQLNLVTPGQAKASAAGAALAGSSKIDSPLSGIALADGEAKASSESRKPEPFGNGKSVEPVLETEDPLAEDGAESEEDILDDLEDRGVPSFGGMGKQYFAGSDGPRRSGGKGFLITALVLLVLGGGGYAAWMTQPSFRDLVISVFGLAENRTTAFEELPQVTTKPRSVRVTPAPPASKPQAAALPAAEATDIGTPVADLNANGETLAASEAPTPGQSAGVTADSPSSSDSDATTIGPSKSGSIQTAKQDTTANHSNPNPTFGATNLPASTATKAADLLDVPEDYSDDQVIHRVHPVYPKQARLKKLHGTVVLQAIVNKRGKVDSLQLIAGDPLLAQAAADAVKQWRYKPYSHGGEPTDFQTRVTVDFKLP